MSRRKKLLDDLETVYAEFLKKSSFIQDIRFEDESLFFVYNNGNKNQCQSYTLHLNDYPDSSLLFIGNDSKVCEGTLLHIIKDLIKQNNKKYNIISLTASRSSDIDEEEDVDTRDDLRESTEIDMDDELREVYEQEISYKDHEDLVLELANYRKIFGECITRPMPLLETVDVELTVPFKDILDESVCGAWGIDHQLPIKCKMTFSCDYFLESQKEPKVELFQSSDLKLKKKFKLHFQLEAILNSFIKKNWPGSSGNKIKAIEYISFSSPVVQNFEKNVEKNVESNKKSSWKMWKKEAKPLVNQSGKPISDENVSTLVDMGFEIKDVRNALSGTNSLEEATNFLLTNAPSSEKKSVQKVNDLFSNPNKTISNQEKENIKVDSKYGFLVMCITYLRSRFSTLNDFCVICDQPHVFAHGNMLKPAVCSRELCCFSFQQLGVAGDAADEIATAAEVVDLLVCFATVAAKSPRNQLIFDPFPLIVDSQDPKKIILSPVSKDFSKVNTILSKFPSVEQMSQAKDFSDMKKRMDKAHENAFSLLQWIITSNRSHIVKLNSDKHIKSMETPHQYLLLSAPPEKESKFRSLKEKYGSVFAFHGSSSENWHSILRTGLKNASGTKLQLNGAAYGSGIYISPHAGTSFGYCRIYGTSGFVSNGNRFLDSNNMNCIALCEVINENIKKSGTIWVQPNEDYVVTRFFFVFPNANVGGASNCSTENSSFIDQIKRAMKY